ncbi:RNA 2',3'-cyclic phosphodiesterase [Pseudomonas sp. J452]|uniref:RNA 2',3'-cyclic phosphodiesterase n=1 Tax=Pseudomonas sp. J452 TaxID=2898441 RepID=UPI0021AE1007|nr:RNA 2',3'-cyclic phosphodiesterase [Pseudomonas sp. J452]UUY07542.1 RNA 2',3'-cyclic phosphodiesterase [Pseudomonas sp. J452]
MSAEIEPRLRLFFALPLPPALRLQVENWRNGLAIEGHLLAGSDLHLTLAFLGSQPCSSLARLKRLAAGLHAQQSFCLCLDRLQCWQGGLLHLAPGQVPAALLVLQQNLHAALAQAGFSLETRPYCPHLSLARGSRLPALVSPCAFSWQVEHFALFVSHQQADGSRYQLIGQWPLQLRTS